MCVNSGGRTIVVMGSGFDLIQKATMKVNTSDEFIQDIEPKEVRDYVAWHHCFCLVVKHLCHFRRS